MPTLLSVRSKKVSMGVDLSRNWVRKTPCKNRRLSRSPGLGRRAH